MFASRRASLVLLVAVVGSAFCLRPLAAVRLTADDDVAAPTADAKARKEQYTKWMKTYAAETKISVMRPDQEFSEEGVEFVANPVFRYSDEERQIPDATLWVWTKEGHPVALQKVEGNNWGGGQQWTICFASLSEQLLSVKWSTGRTYVTQAPGLEFKPVPNVDPPAAKSFQRTAQIKSIKDRFSGRLNATETDPGAETRTMPKALFEYAEPETKLPRGAIFGMSSTGTNPDVLLVIEARPDSDGKLQWMYACARMTSSIVLLRLDDTKVWSSTATEGRTFENWMYYFMSRKFS